jgi:threonylcarbamoyladenosine tRNA methylthiotransferase MtaB
MSTGRKAAFHTLGCKLNFSETSTLARDLAEAGYARVSLDDAPDVVVINTCSVTDHADAKCRNAVRRAQNANPEAFVVVVGCYAQLKPNEIAAIDGVDLVLGAGEKFNLVAHLEGASKTGEGIARAGEIKEVRDFVPGHSSGDRTRAFLKVQDGCNYFCAFCTIPLARGRSRSATVAETVAEARRAAAGGAKEIVLTGVNIGDFGTAHGETLLDLVHALDALPEVTRYRISSIEPNLLTDELIDAVAASASFQPHFHLPLQSGSDRILSAMRRRYRTALYRERVARIRQRMPDASIGVDVIVGFPGEDEAAFLECVDFIKSLDISYLHVFTYSERPNTTALRMDDVVPVEVRRERNKVLRGLSLKKQRAHYEAHLGQSLPVLFEAAEEDGLRMGFTPNYIRVAMNASEVAANEVRHVSLQRVHAEGHVRGTWTLPVTDPATPPLPSSPIAAPPATAPR